MDMEKISSVSSLVTPELEEQLRGVLGKLAGEVQMACVVDLEDRACVEMAELARHVVGLSEKLSCQF